MAYFRLETDYRRFLCSFKDCLNLLKRKLHIFVMTIYYDFGNQDDFCIGGYFGPSEVPDHFFSIAEVMGKCVGEEGNNAYSIAYLDLSDCPFSFEEVPLFFFPPVDNPELAPDIQELLSQNILGFYQWKGLYEDEADLVVKSVLSLEDGRNVMDSYVNTYSCEENEDIELYIFDTQGGPHGFHVSRVFCLCDKETNKALLSFTFSSPYVFHKHVSGEHPEVPPAIITTTIEVAREKLYYLEDGSIQRKYQYLTKTETGEVWWM